MGLFGSRNEIAREPIKQQPPIQSAPKEPVMATQRICGTPECPHNFNHIFEETYRPPTKDIISSLGELMEGSVEFDSEDAVKLMTSTLLEKKNYVMSICEHCGAVINRPPVEKDTSDDSGHT